MAATAPSPWKREPNASTVNSFSSTPPHLNESLHVFRGVSNMSNKGFRTFILTLASAVLALTTCAPASGQSDSKQEKQEKREEKKETMAQGTPVFWQEPTDISSRNLLLGLGGEEMKPDLKQIIWEESVPE